MQKLLCFIISLMMAGAAKQLVAQNRQADSLLNLLKTDIEDSNKVYHLNKLSRQYRLIGEYGKGLGVSMQAKELGRKIKFKKGEGNACNNAGLLYQDEGNYPEALVNYFTALRIFEEIKYKQGTANVFNNIGIVYDYQKNYPEALKMLESSLTLKQEIKDKYGIATTYCNMGIIYKEQGKYPEALEKYTTALKMLQGMQDIQGTAYTLENIGTIYVSQGMELRNKSRPASDAKLKEALRVYRVSLKQKEEIKDKEGIITSYINIGDVCGKSERYIDKSINKLKGR